ncbi:MAG TPA: hypothetical protein EYO61_04445, partial [Campylobacterales bacterium]|nr:hypothetical protein [Campylobacterales bacterium]
MDKFVWNGKIESEIDTVNFETFQEKVCLKDEFETTKEYKERLIKEGYFNKWLGKQIVSMQYNDDIEQFRVAIENRWGKVLEFDIAVPRAGGVAEGFKE